MLFNSYTFAIFLAVVLVLHHLPLPWRCRKLNLLVASYVFYAAWDPPFVVLLWFTTALDWIAAACIARARSPRSRRAWLGASLAANLGLLAFFKYGGFALQNLRAGAAALGVDLHFAAPDIVLPIGISFYTFQTLSYTVDVYRRQSQPCRSFLDYALYVTFFPQLVAGPIVRAGEFLPQCGAPRRATGAQFGWGLALLVVGLFQKTVVADGLLAPIADQLYGDLHQPSPLAAWHGTLAFAGQIYCDFAGYSACALGAAMCLGFALPDNFRCPYAAIGFSDFWRRWHVSLSTWLRDYLYVPLGGNRGGSGRTLANLMATMLIGGLWHGASWTFVVWGGLHGAFLVAERALRAALPPRPLWQAPAVRFALGLLTFAAVCLAWVFFRATSFTQAWQIVTAMLGVAAAPAELGLDDEAILTTRVAMIALLALHWLMRDRTLEAATARCPWALRAALLAAMLVTLVHMPGDDRAFLYFQF